ELVARELQRPFGIDLPLEHDAAFVVLSVVNHDDAKIVGYALLEADLRSGIATGIDAGDIDGKRVDKRENARSDQLGGRLEQQAGTAGRRHSAAVLHQPA